jgi:uncharacterized membrane protein YkgB
MPMSLQVGLAALAATQSIEILSLLFYTITIWDTPLHQFLALSGIFFIAHKKYVIT